MKVVAAYLLACLGGNANPSVADIKSIFNSVGIEADDDRVELFISQVSGKDITELIAAGREKLASVPAGGGVAVAVSAGAAPGGAAPGGAAPAAAESKKEEKEEVQEESDEDIGFSLFDD